MNEIIEAMLNRRSCRSYKPDQVEEEKLQAILKAGTFAASGHGKQSAKIVVVQDKETIAQLSRMNAAILGSSGDPFYGAPTVCVVLADPEVMYTWIEDGSLVMGNLMLAASALGVDSCWIHRAREEFDSPEGKALLRKWGIPEHFRGVGHCILGYGDGPLAAPKARKEDFIVRV